MTTLIEVRGGDGRLIGALVALEARQLTLSLFEGASI